MNVATELEKRGFASDLFGLKGTLKEVAGSFIFDVKVFCITIRHVGNKFGDASRFNRFKKEVEMVWHQTVGSDPNLLI